MSSDGSEKFGGPGKLYKSGPHGEAIEIEPETPYKGPDKLAKRGDKPDD